MKPGVLATGLLCLGLMGAAHPAIETYGFRSEAERARYRDLVETLRCPKCQNQNIADSNAPIANDLRSEVRRLLDMGQSDQQIIDFMVERYGDFVLYDPPFDIRTLLLWLGPGALLLAGALTLHARVARARTSHHLDTLSDGDRRRLAELLRDADASTTIHD